MSTVKQDTSKSDQIVQGFRQKGFEPKRKISEFLATFDAPVEKVGSLLNPLREADWNPGWDCELLYSDSDYVKENCIIVTKSHHGPGTAVGMVVGFEANRYLDLVLLEEHVSLRIRVTTTDNGNGSATVTFSFISTGLTEQGNKAVDKIPDTDTLSNVLPKMIEHYLRKGTAIKRASLALGMVAEGIRGHFG